MDPPATYGTTPAGLKDEPKDLQAQAQQLADDAQAEIAALRARVEALMDERVTPALAQAADAAEAKFNAARVRVRAGGEQVSARVREQPLLALGVAALVGFVVAALVRR